MSLKMFLQAVQGNIRTGVPGWFMRKMCLLLPNINQKRMKLYRIDSKVPDSLVSPEDFVMSNQPSNGNQSQQCDSKYLLRF